MILIPLFNDWDAAALLLRELEHALGGFAMIPEVLFIDDGSTDVRPPAFAQGPFQTIHSIDVLHLRRNLGHQRAIAVGLVFVYEHRPCGAVVVMDADGEDRPGDVPALAAEFTRDGGKSIIFAARSKRLERFLFRFFYQLYRLVHWVLTGDPVKVGNFSIVPAASLEKLVVVPEIWNHYAAAVVRSRLAFRTIPLARGRRLAGHPRMNFIGLLLHGLSAFFVYGEIVGARLLLAISAALFLEIVLATVASALLFNAGGSALGLAASLAVLLGLILLQAIPVALILVFTVIGSRANIGFLPIRDCPYFVSRVERVYPC